MTAGVNVPSELASLPTISFSQLVQTSASEAEKLIDAARHHGFFYLDLRGPETEEFLSDYRRLEDVAVQYFDQPHDVKMHDDRANHASGYDPPGSSSGAVEGSRDCYEALKILKTHIAENRGDLPDTVKQHLTLFQRYQSQAHTVTLTVLTALSDQLGLKDNLRLEFSHADDEPSRSMLALVRYPATDEPNNDKIGIQKHTDLGSLTLVLSSRWGLQIIPPGVKEWRYIEPRSGHAVVNIGDSVRFLSRNQLKSAIHRVYPLEGRQVEDRLSIIYFLRPSDKVQYLDSNGKATTALEWHDRKYDTFRLDHEEHARDTLITGGMERQDAIAV